MTAITVTYNANANPSIEVTPYNPHVKGEDVLTWTAVNCTFPATNGIVFVPDPTATTPWPYAQPTQQPDGTYQVTDPNTEGGSITYNYNVTIISNGGRSHTRVDPDVTNTPE